MTGSVAEYARECAANGMRGDYSACLPDFTVPQSGPPRDAAQCAIWQHLSKRQQALAQEYAHPAYLNGLETLGLIDRLPDFDVVSARLRRMTGWTIVPVPGLIPAEPFFGHLANRRFPVTNWLRGEDELDYIVEPDMFHDFFGHVPILTQPVFADFMQLYGARAMDTIQLGGDEMITRLYWYTAEFGLIREAGGPLKAFGAGLMSSASELPFALGPDAKRQRADVETIMRTSYEIDSFQRVYFVLGSFSDLFEQFERLVMSTLIGRWKDTEPIDPDTL